MKEAAVCDNIWIIKIIAKLVILAPVSVIVSSLRITVHLVSMSALDKLSERDKAVLRSIFDPTATIAEVAEDEDTFTEESEGNKSEGNLL